MTATPSRPSVPANIPAASRSGHFGTSGKRTGLRSPSTLSPALSAEASLRALWLGEPEATLEWCACLDAEHNVHDIEQEAARFYEQRLYATLPRVKEQAEPPIGYSETGSQPLHYVVYVEGKWHKQLGMPAALLSVAKRWQLTACRAQFFDHSPGAKRAMGIPMQALGYVRREAPPTSAQTQVEDGQLETDFHALAQEWAKQTMFTSSTTDIVLHPAYQRIIGLGKPALPLILRELATEPNHWFWALQCISGENPAAGLTDFDEAVEVWLSWGSERGYFHAR